MKSKFLISIAIIAYSVQLVSAQRLAPTWFYQIGGTGQDFAVEIEYDAFGNRYCAGTFQNTVDFDPGIDEENLTSAGSFDGYISKVDADGKLLWAAKMGGTGDDRLTGICLDGAANVLACGYFSGTILFDVGKSNISLVSNGGNDIFIAKYSAAGDFIWAKNIGGPQLDEALSVRCNANSEVFLAGSYTGNVDFDPNASEAWFNSGGVRNAFLLKLDTGANFIWNRTVDDTKESFAISLVLDWTGNPLMGGWFSDTADLDLSTKYAMNKVAQGIYDAFLVKMMRNGNFSWARQLSGGYVKLNGLSVDRNNNTYLTGSFSDSINMNPNSGKAMAYSTGMDDGFVIKLNTNGFYTWGRTIRSTENIIGRAVASDSLGFVYVVGNYSGSTDFGTGTNPVIRQSIQFRGGYLARYTQSGEIAAINTFDNLDAGTDIGPQKIVAIDDKNLLLTGYFSGRAFFDFGDTNSISYTSAGMADGFFMQLHGCQVWSAPINRPPRCFRDTLPSGKIVEWEGVYIDTVKNYGGCDSILLVIANVGRVDTTISIAGGQLTSNSHSIPWWGPNYEWLDCDDGYRVVGRERVFMAPKNGNYALRISDDQCQDITTQCYRISQVGLKGTFAPALNIYPNPGFGQYMLDFGNLTPESVAVTDLNGRLVKQWNELNNGLMMIELDTAPGIYFISINADGIEHRHKLIHQR